MLKDFVIKEIKTLDFYDESNTLVRSIYNLTNAELLDDNGHIAKLKGNYSKHSGDYLTLNIGKKLYKIKGKVLLEDMHTKKIYEGDFMAFYAIIECDGFEKVEINLLKLNDADLYRIEVSTEEIEIDRNNKLCFDSLTDLVNDLFDTLADKPSLETWKLIQELLDYQSQYNNKLKKANTNNTIDDTRKIKNITVFYDDDTECRIASIYEIKDIIDNQLKNRQ